ncbi:glycoside hydrolase family 38 C-terminal domain-containing protein [Silvibacterium sp.]|uniref:glycoside hydrolase family 38 N-terminal domain-containing protein n=1 Tax=Silvibacterium sp. TaxID=1964179 RepID=UPI0039E69EE4
MRFPRPRTGSALLAFATLTLASFAQSTAKPDLSNEPTLYAVGYAHLDTEWRWEYPQVIDEYLRNTMEHNFTLFEKYPHYIFNFSGANRYRLMKEYFPQDFAKVDQYVASGQWFPAGSSMEEGDVNAPNAEAIIRQILYGNEWFQKEFGKSSEEYMLPDCFGFPASLPSILAHSGVKGFSTQKLTWGSSAPGGGPESLERTPEGTPFNVGVWVGPDGSSVVAALNPGAYNGNITTDLSKPLDPEPPNPAAQDIEKRMGELEAKLVKAQKEKKEDPEDLKEYFALRSEQQALAEFNEQRELQRFQGDWAARVLNNGKVTGVFADYHYYGIGDTGGSPREPSVKLLEQIVDKGKAQLPEGGFGMMRGGNRGEGPEVQVGEGPVHVVSATADQMFKDITPAQVAELPRYTGEMELTNHSAGSLTSQAYQKRWIRKEELLADAAEESSVAAQWLGAREYPIGRLNDAWTLAMAAHFHDLAAGTATPRAYNFAWNDDVIAMNQFSDVLKSATEGVAAALDTDGAGVPVVVFNELNIARQDLVTAEVAFPGGLPKEVHVVGADGKASPAQIVNGKVVFAASVPSVGYAVYHVLPGAVAAESKLSVSEHSLENAYYKVTIDEHGDVSSIYDKQAKQELLRAPARLSLNYDNPQQWPAWNMDWDQEQAKPREYVSGPAKIRVVENGPVRVAVEISRETAGSRFVQTVSLSAGDAGKRVEFGNVIDWASREVNLKAEFPLTASNELATYNWDIGTIQRPSATPKKFEVPSHQWVDLTDASGKFGATILTDAKNGSDKPNDHTIRLTLLRTPGTSGGYSDEASQDIGHHEFTYGIAGHADGWRDAQTDWQGQRLNAPLVGFESPKHTGTLGKSFSLVKVSSPRVRVMAVKKAEKSDEVVIRLVELDGKPLEDVKVNFAAPIVAAREVNGQEQPLGEATVKEGALVTSFGAYQPRAFALKLAASKTAVAAVKSEAVTLQYDTATATNDGTTTQGGFDGKGDALPAEMLPQEIAFNGVKFALAAAKTGTPNAVTAKGQSIALPAGHYNRVYVLAASAEGDQKAVFTAGENKAELNIQDWGGFVGQWDNRIWSLNDYAHDNYGEMVGLKPGFIKRASLAWYASHHHDAAGKNVPYAYSYLFGYSIELPAGAKMLTLPDNDKIRVLAVSVAEENPEVKPVQPLYDVLPSPNAGAPDFSLTAPAKTSVSQGRSVKSHVLILPRGSFDSDISLTASGLPEGVTASFEPATTKGSSVLTLTASSSAAPATSTVTISAAAGDVAHTTTIELTVTEVVKGAVPVDLSSSYNVTGIYKDGTKFDSAVSLDDDCCALSTEALGTDPVGADVVFHLGPPNAPDAVANKTVALPEGKYTALKVLATGVEGTQKRQVFTVTYTDGTSSVFSQNISDWASDGGQKGESPAAEMAYRVTTDGGKDGGPFHLFAYSFPLDGGKSVKSVTLPGNRNVVVLGITLVPVK